MLKRLAALFLLLVGVLAAGEALAEGHPFLIVTESDYPALRARADRSPWKEMKEEAAVRAQEPFVKDPYRVRNVVSAAALMYILDDERSDTYRAKILDGIGFLDSLVFAGGYPSGVGGGTVLFSCILGLDIIHGTVSDSLREVLEASIAEKVHRVHGPWLLNTYGIKAIWALYSGDRINFQKNKELYDDALHSYLTDSGVNSFGPGYAWSRYSGSTSKRDVKTHFMDVMEFTGEGSYYSDGRLSDLYEWLFGYSVTPFRLNFTFGDSPWDKPVYYGKTGLFRAYRFSDLAAGYAAWANRDAPPEGLLLGYVLTDRPLPEPVRPTSRIFEDGGAWFLEQSPEETALAGALWNPRSSESHSHKDVNAIHLCAFGENVVQNSGYAGWSTPAMGFPWTYIHDTAVSSNTVLVDDVDHEQKHGGGIVEGLTTTFFDFATGYSHTALPNARHWRTLAFIHPQQEAGGYWVLFDEVSAEDDSSRINIVLHPSSSAYREVAAHTHYEWTIQRRRDKPTSLSVFLATPPEGVDVRDGVLAGAESFIGKYLYSTYASDGEGRASISTILFPHDGAHPVAQMGRIGGSHFSGAHVLHSEDAVDVVLESTGADTVRVEDMALLAKSAVYRKDQGRLSFYFLRGARYFRHDGAERVGFAADLPVSITMKGNRGKIASPGTSISFYTSGIREIRLNGAPVAGDTATVLGAVAFEVPPGTHEIELVPSNFVGRQPAARIPQAFELQQNYPNPFNPETTIRYALPEAADVQLSVHNVFGQRVAILVQERQGAGHHESVWHAGEAASGLYFYVLRAGSHQAVRPMALLR